MIDSQAIPKVTKVLIVEDEPAQMQVTRRALESHGTFHLTCAQNADVEEGFSAGAQAYLLKPFDWDTAWPKLQPLLQP